MKVKSMNTLHQKIVAMLLTMTVVFISVMTYALLGTMDHQSHARCPVAAMADCPPVDTGVGMALHHLNAINSLTRAVVTDTATVLLAGIILLLSFAIPIFRRWMPSIRFQTKQRPYYFTDESSQYSVQRFLRWLSVVTKQNPLVVTA